MNGKKILILYHMKEREYTICEIIKDAIMKQNNENEVIIGNFHSDYRIAFTFRPEIIISIPPRAEWASSILTILKISVNPIIVSMITEGLHKYDLETLKLMIGYNEYSSQLVDYYMYWGPKAAEVFGKELMAEHKVTSIQRVKFSGYVMYEKNMISNRFAKSPMNIRLREIKSKYDTIVTWVTGFPGANETIDELEEMGCFEHGDEAAYKEAVESAKKRISASQRYRAAYIRHIVTMAESYSDIFFIVKLHPVEVNDMQRNKKNPYQEFFEGGGYSNVLLVTESMPIGIILPYTDIFVHYGSTTGLEAYIYKIPTVQLIVQSEAYANTNYGRVLYPSTKNIDIDSEQTGKEIIECNHKFKPIAELDNFLFERFNYKREEAYHPSEKIAEIMNSDLSRQEISMKDPLVKKVLKSQVAFYVREELYKKAILDIFKLKFKSVCCTIGILNKIKPQFGTVFIDCWLEIKNKRKARRNS